jgi:hypothetical protein
MSSATVTVEGSGRKVAVPITVQTRVWQAAAYLTRELGAVPGTVELLAAGMPIDPARRMVALPDHVVLTARLATLPEDDASVLSGTRTPRLVPAPKQAERIQLTIEAEGGQRLRVNVDPRDAVRTLRTLAGLTDSNLVMQVKGRRIVDEGRSFADLLIDSTTPVFFGEASPTRAVDSYIAGYSPHTHPTMEQLRGSYEYEARLDEALDPRLHFPEPISARRRFARLVRILFADPDDGEFTYELDVYAGRTVGSLLQFVEEEPRYAILCDGRPVASDTTFLQATEGYDGSLFTFAPSTDPAPPPQAETPHQRHHRPRRLSQLERDEAAAVNPGTPQSHLSRPFSPGRAPPKAPVPHRSPL